MKVIIAGGRDYSFSVRDLNLLDALHKEHGFSEVVSGGAWGADFEGKQWAARNGVFVKRFPADWKKHGRAAGPITKLNVVHSAMGVWLRVSFKVKRLRIGQRLKACLKINNVGSLSYERRVGNSG